MTQARGKPRYPPSRRRWGQNFLSNRRTAERIVAAVDPRSDDLILEVGPGPGVLTELLASAAGGLVAVEIDEHYATTLRQKFSGRRPSVYILHRDALELSPAEVLGVLGYPEDCGRKIRVVGNLPFNISVRLVRHFLDQLALISDLTCMVQLEVAERMTSLMGVKSWGFLSILIQFYCRTKILFEVGSGSFRPRPHVGAAVVSLRPRSTYPVGEEDEERFFRLAALAFRNRRKTLINNLRSDAFYVGIEDRLPGLFEEFSWDHRRRGESFTIEELASLTLALKTLERDKIPPVS